MNQSEWPLRAARVERGWSQSRAAEELAALAAQRGVAVAAPLSLKTQLSRWENQHALPDGHYRTMLCELYQSTPGDLGLRDPSEQAESGRSEADELRAALAASAAIDDSALELIRTQLESTRALDDRLGAAAVAGSAQAQLSYLESALRHSVNAMTRRLLGHLVVDAATLSGRLALDLVRPAEAWRYGETAKAGAREAESSTLLGYAMVEQSAVLTEVGEPSSAISIVEQAISMVSNDAPGQVRAWFEAARGGAMANAGAASEAHTAYQSAERALAERPGRMDLTYPDLPIDFDFPALRRRRGHAYRLLHEDESAIEELRRALRAGGSTARELAGVHLDLAWAHGAIGHESEASSHARSARDIATRIGSARLAAQLDSGQPHAVPERINRS
jgi:transcriptional regulator with XRE-family HTH domain